MISKEEVILAYRLLFGRDPENDSVVTHYATEILDLNALRELFINSTEFRSNLEQIQSPRPPKQPFNGPPMDVELAASPEKLTLLLSKIAKQWQHLGETEPHWSVLTNDSYFQENFHQNRDPFYASGEAELTLFDAALQRTKISLNSLAHCVELGCGVGRVTAALATRFERVTAIDISKAHLQIAQCYTDEKHIHNIAFQHLTHFDEINHLGHFDVLYSRIVLQHNPPPVMAKLLTALLHQLQSGGIAFFQIPTYKAGYRFAIDDYLEQSNDTNMEMHFFPQSALFELLATQNCRILEIREDDAIGVSVTAVSNTLLVQKW